MSCSQLSIGSSVLPRIHDWLRFGSVARLPYEEVILSHTYPISTHPQTRVAPAVCGILEASVQMLIMWIVMAMPMGIRMVTLRLRGEGFGFENLNPQLERQIMFGFVR
jgi:hypothetical protein